jgi:hypothetical protein
MLHIWAGTCKNEVSSINDSFEALYESDWFDDLLGNRYISR